MFATCPNFRELGGFLTADGNRVRRGRLFRAGTLTHLGPDDHAVIAGFGIKTVCDLRQASEAEAEPTAWPDVTILSWHYESVIGRVLRRLSSGEITVETADAAMIGFYGELPLALQQGVRGVFHAIATGGTPLLFHCSAGKDRTGVVAGLLLDVLGVGREEILADYARSAELMDYEAILRKNPNSALGFSRDGFSVTGLAPQVRGRLLASDPRFLAAMFAKVEEERGSVEEYLVEVVGVPAEHIARVRDELLD